MILGDQAFFVMIVVYYESTKGETKTRPTHECRCDERLKTKTEESTHLAFTVPKGKDEVSSNLVDEMFPSVMVSMCSRSDCLL
jgi:lactate dehydrogenase-like 2-hydroxyacid dehydrogenase